MANNVHYLIKSLSPYLSVGTNGFSEINALLKNIRETNFSADYILLKYEIFHFGFRFHPKNILFTNLTYKLPEILQPNLHFRQIVGVLLHPCCISTFCFRRGIFYHCLLFTLNPKNSVT